MDDMRARLEMRPGVDLQLQPADQGSRRGVDLRHPRPDRREDLRRRSEPDAREAGARSKAILVGTRGVARRRDLPGRQRAAHRRRHRSRSDRALRRVGAGRRGRARDRVRRAAGDERVGGRAQVACASSSRSPSEGDPGRRSGGSDDPAPSNGAPAARRRWRRCTSTRGRTQINREQGQPLPGDQVQHRGARHGHFVDEAQARVRREVKLPEGYHLTWGGEFENQRRAMKRLAFIVPVSILVIFALLYLTFSAVLPALVVLLVVPFATVGGVFALYLTTRCCRCRRRSGSSRCSGVGHGWRADRDYMRRARRAPGAPTARTRSCTRSPSGCGPC